MNRVDGALTISAAALAAVLAVARPFLVLLVVAVSVVVTFARGGCRPSRRVVVVAAVLALLAYVRARGVIARDALDAERVAVALPRPERCEIVGVVASMPTMRGVLGANLVVESIVCDARAPPLSGVRARLYDLPAATARGDRLRVIAQIAPSRRPSNPDLGDPRPSYARRGHALSGSAIAVELLDRGEGWLSLLDRTRAALRQGLTASIAAPELSPIARAMVLGEEDLTEADDEAFRRSGLTHLLAVSGSHVALVVGGLVALLRRALIRFTHLARRVEVSRIAAAIGIVLALAYEQLSGDSGSARRATLMAIVVLSVRIVGRRVDLARTLGLSLLAALAIDPLAPFDLSFCLSIAATLGLIGLGPVVERWLSPLPELPRRALSATVSASAACAPFIAGISGALPLLGLLANLVAVPIGELAALPLCNFAALAGALLPPFAARAIGDVTAGSLVMLRAVARIAAAPELAVLAVPSPTAPQLAWIIATAIAIALAPARRVLFGLLGLAGLLLLELGHLRFARPAGVLRVTVLDIGQGDATLIDLPAGGAILIDGGGEVGSAWDPGRAVVAPVLRARRRSVLDLAVLSHPHPDHFLGLRAALAGVRVGAFWENGEARADSELGRWFGTLRARGVPVLAPSCAARELSGARIEVLHPCPSFDPDRGANDNSIVLRITYGRRAVLLVGDAEHEAEKLLLQRPHLLRADVLKVGHHGSRTSSSPEFLAAVRPQYATISCGVRNRFGHPHKNALQALSASGARVLRTDLDGAIRITTDGDRLEVLTAHDGGW